MLIATYISTYFTWDEVCHSEWAARNSVDNVPPAAIAMNLQYTAIQMDKVRKLLNRPVIVSSWYRSAEVNAGVGSKSKRSQHTKGEAVDFICPGYGSPKEVATLLAKNIDTLRFDQLIYEYSWVHISFSPVPRGQIFTLDSKTGQSIPGIA